MSVKKVAAVLYDLKIKDASAKLVLLVLADHYNESTGDCFPSQQRIMDATSLSRATVIRKLKWLEEAGLISRVKRYNNSDIYSLVFEKSQIETSQIETFGVSQCDTNQKEPLPINKKKKYLVEDLQLDDELIQYAKEKGVDPYKLLETLQLWSEQNGGKRYHNLKAFFKNCVRKEADNPRKLQSKTDSLVGGGKKMLTMDDWNALSDTMRDYYRRMRPDVIRQLGL